MNTSIICKGILFVCLISMPDKARADLLSWAENVLRLDEIPSTVDQALGLLISDIVKEYFINYRCIVLITVGNFSNEREIYQSLPAGVFSVLHIHVADVANYETMIKPEEWYGRKTWFDELILASLDHRCEGYIFQTPDLKRSIHTILKQSKWATQRLSRFYIFIPYVSGEDVLTPEVWDEEIRDMFRVHTMRDFPDILMITEIKKAEITGNFHEKVDYDKTSSKYRSDGEGNATHETHSKNFEDLEYNTNFKEAEMQKNNSEEKFLNKKVSEHLYEEHNATYSCESDINISLINSEDNITACNNLERSALEYEYTRSYRNTRAIFDNETSGKFSSFAFKIITQKYVYPDPSEPLVLDIWESNSGFQKHTNLYPDKLVDLMGKPFYPSSMTYLPFSYLEIGNKSSTLDGFEYRMVEAFAKKLNMSIDVRRGSIDSWGHVFSNGSTGGIIGLTADNMADISFAAFNYWQEEYRFLDYTTPHEMTKLTALAPKPVLLPRILVPVYPFSYGLWLAILVYLVITVFMLYALSKVSQKVLGGDTTSPYSSLYECAYRTFSMLVLQVPDEEDQSVPRNVPMRHFINWLVIQFLVITTGYAAGLAAVLTTPRFTPPIETANDLAASGFKWAAYDVAYGTTLMESPDPLYKSLYRQFTYGTEEELGRKIMKGDMAYAVEILQGGSSAVQPFFTEDSMDKLRLMSGKIYGGHLGFLVIKGSPFKEKLDRVLFSLKEGGLHLFMEKEVARKYMNQRLQIAVLQTRERTELGPVNLQFAHVEGVFIVLILGLILSTVGFLTEHIYFRFSGAKELLGVSTKQKQ